MELETVNLLQTGRACSL